MHVEVPLKPSEEAVLLVEQEGMYTFLLATDRQDVLRSRVRRGSPGKARAFRNKAVFEIEINRGAESSARRSNLLGLVWGQVRMYVLRFAADLVVKEGVKFLERNVHNGFVDMRSGDPTKWLLLDSLDALKLPSDRPPRILLFVHGTVVAETRKGSKFAAFLATALTGAKTDLVTAAKAQLPENRRAAEQLAKDTQDENDAAAVVALIEVQKAEGDLAKLAADATPSDRAQKESALKQAQIKANKAYRKAGRPEPYPGVAP